MPGSVVDLSTPGIRFPDPIVVDTNLIVERLVVPFIGAPPPSNAVDPQRATRFFNDVAANNGTGIVTPMVFNEVIHVAIRFRYRQVRLNLGAAAHQKFGRPVRDWRDLYKLDIGILQAFGPRLEQLRQLLIANGLLFVSPDELGPIESRRSYDEELISLVAKDGLDSNDVVILMEAQRCGVVDIATLDPDLQRAQADFNIYTWL